MQIGQKIRHRIEAILQSKGQPLTQASISVSGKCPVEIDPVFRDHPLGACIKSVRICQRQQNYIPGHGGWIQLLSQSPESLYPHILTAMHSGSHHQCPAGFCTAQADTVQRLGIRNRKRHPLSLPGQDGLSAKGHTASSSSASKTTIDSSRRRAYSSRVSLIRLTGRYSVTCP